MNTCVYVICFPNGKLYVGRTLAAASHRFQEHCQSKYPVGRAIRKYGKENVCLVVLHSDLSWKQAGKLEQRWIAQLGAMSPGGYNLTAGGDGAIGFRHSDVARQRIGQSSRERPRTVEHGQRIAEAKRGRPRPDLRGEQLSPEHRHKIAEAMRGRSLSKEHRARLAGAMKGNKNATRK